MHIVNSVQSFWDIEKHLKSAVYIPEHITTSYEVFESQEQIVSVQQLFDKARVPFFYRPPLDVAEKVPEVRLRQTVARKLLTAAKKLPKRIVFSISEGYRPLWYQKQIFAEIVHGIKQKYPDFTDRQLWEEATKYVADPSLVPPHTTGGAIDITLAYKNGKLLDMGAPLNAADESANTFYEHLTTQQKHNRTLLFDTLTSVCFVNLPTEWWHYSYGDQYWAIYNHQPNAIYDKISV